MTAKERDLFPHLRGAALTDIGRKRKNNEDSYGAFPEFGIWCVADGMGGGDDGEVASAAVVKAIDAYLSNLPVPDVGAYDGTALAGGLSSTLRSVSAWILKRARQNDLKGCGSTFVGVVFDPVNPGTALALHVGDSRLYRLRGRDIKQVTKDHSVAEMMGAKDESELNPMFRGMILRAVGIEGDVEVEKTPFAVQQNDVVLICSDGLTRMVPDKRIAEIVRDCGEDVDRAVKALIAAANDAGGIDNVTVELIRVGALPPSAKSVRLEGGEEGSVSSSTITTLDRECGSGLRHLPWRTLAVVGGTLLVLALIGWLGYGIVNSNDRRVKEAPVVDSLPVAEQAVEQKQPVPAVEQPVPEQPAPEQPAPEQPAAEQPAVAPERPAPASETPVAAPVPAAVTNECDSEMEKLRVERERRRREDAAVKEQERRRHEVAKELASFYYRDEFVDTVNFVNKRLGRGSGDRLLSLGKALKDRLDEVDVCETAVELTKELATLAQKIRAKYTNDLLREHCDRMISADAASVDGQRTCVEFMQFISSVQKRANGRRR